MNFSGTEVATFSPATSGGLPETFFTMWGVKIIKFCKKCNGDTDRNTRGSCKQCSNARGAAYRASNQDKVRADKAAYYLKNLEKIKEARRANRKANPGKEKARNSAYYAANSDNVKSTARAYRKANLDAAKARWSAYYKANSKKINAISRVWAQANREKVAAYNRAWKNKNPDIARARDHRRRARKRNATGQHTASDIKALFILQKGKCACCRVSIKDGYHVDHRMPLKLEGSNDKYNLQLLCPRCNLSKGAKDPIDFMQSKGFLL